MTIQRYSNYCKCYQRHIVNAIKDHILFIIISCTNITFEKKNSEYKLITSMYVGYCIIYISIVLGCVFIIGCVLPKMCTVLYTTKDALINLFLVKSSARSLLRSIKSLLI